MRFVGKKISPILGLEGPGAGTQLCPEPRRSGPRKLSLAGLTSASQDQRALRPRRPVSPPPCGPPASRGRVHAVTCPLVTSRYVSLAVRGAGNQGHKTCSPPERMGTPPQRHTRQPSAARRSHEGAAEEEAEACVNADASPGAQLCARQVPSGHNCTCLGNLSAPGSFHPRVVGQPCVLGKHWSHMDSVGDESPVVGAGNLNPRRSQDSPRALQARPESRAAQEPVSLSCGVAGSVRGCQLPPGSRDWSQRKEALSSVNVTCSLSLLPASRSTCPGDGHPLSIYPESGSAPRDRPSPPLAGSSQTGKQSMQPKTRTRKRGMEREWG